MKTYKPILSFITRLLAFVEPKRSALRRKSVAGILPAGLCTLFTIGFMPWLAHAGLAIPYSPDADTLHLWHLDDTNGLYTEDAVATSASASANAIPITLTNLGEPTPGTFPYTNTSLANPSYLGLGTSYTGTDNHHLLYGGAFPDVSQFCNPNSGAFTFEAVVNLNGPYATAPGQIVSGDNGGGLTSRGWQWRINNGSMNWNLLGGNAADNNFTAALPTTGPDAVATNVWYHAAVTYTGNNPTNGDAPNVLTFYWTLLDPSRTNADMLAQFTATRPLNGSPAGNTTPSLGIGGSARNTTSNPGNNDGVIGSEDEVRVSDIARASGNMAFMTGGAIAPSITHNPPASVLVAYGGTLNINATVSASSATYVWSVNGTPVPGQSSSSLVISNVTFANAGPYVLVVSNSLGSATSTVSQVSIGASATGLYSTGVADNGQVAPGDVPDLHYTLIESQDINDLGPSAMVFEFSFPIQGAPGVTDGQYAAGGGSSMWIGDQGNPGGAYGNSSPGIYIYHTTFLLDQANPSSISLQMGVLLPGSISNIVLNGLSTGLSFNAAQFALSPALTLNTVSLSSSNGVLSVHAIGSGIASQSYTVNSSSNWFVPGLNTLDFVENITSSGSAIQIENPSAVGLALPPGLPTILAQPVSQKVRDANITGSGTDVKFSVVALGRPPLTYQWYTNGFLLNGGTNRTLNYSNAAAGLQGTNFFVVVANSSGSITSQVAALTFVPTNQLPIAPNYTNYLYTNQTLSLDLSVLFNHASSPDGDALTLSSYDTSTTNGVGLNFVTPTLFTYTPNPGFLGQDSLTYTITDSQGNSAVGTNFIEVVPTLLPTVAAPTRSGNNVVMSGTGGSPGAPYLILGSNSLLTPVSSWPTVATGNFDAQGKFSISLPISGGAATEFYVLAVP